MSNELRISGELVKPYSQRHSMDFSEKCFLVAASAQHSDGSLLWHRQSADALSQSRAKGSAQFRAKREHVI